MNKQEFKEKAKQSITRANGKIEELEFMLHNGKFDTQWDNEEQIEILKKKKSSLEFKYRAVSEIAEDKWEETKEDYIRTIIDLKTKINRTMD